MRYVVGVEALLPVELFVHVDAELPDVAEEDARRWVKETGLSAIVACYPREIPDQRAREVASNRVNPEREDVSKARVALQWTDEELAERVKRMEELLGKMRKGVRP